MQLIFADDQHRDNLLPFVFLRPVSELRCGILTMREKWERILNPDSEASSFITPSYLQVKFPFAAAGNGNYIIINGALLPETEIIKSIRSLKPGQQLIKGDRCLAANVTLEQVNNSSRFEIMKGIETISFNHETRLLNKMFDLFRLNDYAIRFDFKLLTDSRKSATISSTNQVRNPDNVFIEEGAVVENSIINASAGPVYIGKNAEVMEGCMIRGPFALGDHAILKMGTKIYGATTIGPGCRAGGEINNSVMMANSNKAHDGFLGNSVLGEWCNLGADSNNSNLKNNYGEVKIWNYASRSYQGTGLQFCGLFMGDHSKCAINTSFNTGTVTGIGANIFMHGFPPKFIPSFSWGGDENAPLFELGKMLELAQTVMQRRNLTLSEADRTILTHLYVEP